MIQLHRLGADSAPFILNPDLIVMVEATPDTHIALTTGTKVVVTESVEAVVDAVRDWRAGLPPGPFPPTHRVKGAPRAVKIAAEPPITHLNVHEGRLCHRNRTRHLRPPR